MNKVILMGRLTVDPELKQTQSGTLITQFSIAVDRPVKQGAEKQADFIRCAAFNKTAEFICKWFAKGSPITAEGNIKTGSYNDSRYPDVKHYTQDVWIEKVEFVPQNKQNGSQTTGNTQTGNYTPVPSNVPQTGAQPPQSVGGYDLGDFEEIISDGDLPF